MVNRASKIQTRGKGAGLTKQLPGLCFQSLLAEPPSMPPPVGAPSASAQRPTRPNSRKFASSKSEKPSYADPDDFETSSKKSQRSTAYTTPLHFELSAAAKRTSESERKALSNPAKLTKENLQNLQAAHEANFHVEESSDFDPDFLAQAFMRKSKSRSPEKKKPDKKKNQSTHPLNLPPEELRRLSARMARDEKRNSAQMDVDVESSQSAQSGEAQADNGSSTHSQPETPAADKTPGAFPETNGDGREENKSPPPPPHRINSNIQPKMDPEAAKAAGNKFFKAKDYGRAVVEYTKGMYLLHNSESLLTMRSCRSRSFKPNIPVKQSSRIHVRQQIPGSPGRLSTSRST